MRFNDHSNLEGMHAFLGASKYHWINYSDEKLVESFTNMLAAARGTEIHELAQRLVKHGITLPLYQTDEDGNIIFDELGNPIPNNTTLALYVRDAIKYKMYPEQILYFSENCFGTADAISFNRGMLRIHDLKTGVVVKAHMEQLMVYAALFCLEYKKDPNKIKMELRIYQNNEVVYYIPEGHEIREIMEKIKHFDKIISDIRQKGTSDVSVL